MALSCKSVSVSHDSGAVSKHVQYQDPGTEGAKWNSANINFNHHFNSTCFSSLSKTCAYITHNAPQPPTVRSVSSILMCCARSGWCSPEPVACYRGLVNSLLSMSTPPDLVNFSPSRHQVINCLK